IEKARAAADAAESARHGEMIRAAKAEGRRLDFLPLDAEARGAADRAVAKLLTPAQRRRLGEISVQIRGVWALVDPDVSGPLNLAPDTVAAVRAELQAGQDRVAAASQARQAARRRPDGTDPDPGERRVMADAKGDRRVTAAAEVRALRLLTKRQREK